MGHYGGVDDFWDRRWVRVGVLVGGVCLIAAVVAFASWATVKRPGPEADRTEPGAQVLTYDEPGGSASPDGPDLTSNDAMFAATGVPPDKCAPDREYDWNAPGQSFTCVVGSADVRVARYRSADSKADRLADYGECTELDGGWQLCGPNPDSGRWVRSFVEDDLLFYVSSADKDVLLGLDTSDETAVRSG
jgi:hypothetical protein